MCVFNGVSGASACSAPLVHTNATALYGLSANAVCDAHYNGIRGLIANAYPGLSGGYVQDFVMLKVLMMDRATCIQQMQYLNDNMTNLDLVAPHGGPRLSVCLAPYELKCWFPDYIIAPLGFVEHDFNKLLMSGFVAMNDLGAGPSHGKYTHRMQLHIVMRIVTNHFATHIRAPWQHSPLDLYMKCASTVGQIGQPGHTNGGLPDHSTNLFGYIFDLGDGQTGTFGHPDNLFTAMRSTAGLGGISRTATKNFNKRVAERTAYNTATGLRNAHPAVTGAMLLAAERANRDALSKLNPKRIVANMKVGTTRRAMEAAGPAPAVPAPPPEAYRQKLIPRHYTDMGTIADPDPYNIRAGAPSPAVDFGNLVVVSPLNSQGLPSGPPPSVLTIQTALGSSRGGLNGAVHLPNSAAHGHP